MRKKIHGVKICILDVDYVPDSSSTFEKNIGENPRPPRRPKPQPHPIVSPESVKEVNIGDTFSRLPISEAQLRALKYRGFVCKISNDRRSGVIYHPKSRSCSFVSETTAAMSVGENTSKPSSPKPQPVALLSFEVPTSRSRKKNNSPRYTTPRSRR